MRVCLPHVLKRDALADALTLDNTRIPLVLEDEFFFGIGGFGFGTEFDDRLLKNLLQFTTGCVNELFPFLDFCAPLLTCGDLSVQRPDCGRLLGDLSIDLINERHRKLTDPLRRQRMLRFTEQVFQNQVYRLFLLQFRDERENDNTAALAAVLTTRCDMELRLASQHLVVAVDRVRIGGQLVSDVMRRAEYSCQLVGKRILGNEEIEGPPLKLRKVTLEHRTLDRDGISSLDLRTDLYWAPIPVGAPYISLFLDRSALRCDRDDPAV